MDQKPVGLTFSEAYDVEKMQPTAEWTRIYEQVCNQVIGWGLPIR
jgi:hypothetical protein